MTFEVAVTSVSDYPVSGNSRGEGNPNVSCVLYCIYGRQFCTENGEYVQGSLAIQTNQSETGGIYLDKAYVRQGRWKIML